MPIIRTTGFDFFMFTAELLLSPGVPIERLRLYYDGLLELHSYVRFLLFCFLDAAFKAVP